MSLEESSFHYWAATSFLGKDQGSEIPKLSPTQFKVRKPESHRLIVQVWFGVFLFGCFFKQATPQHLSQPGLQIAEPWGGWKTN